MVPFELRYVLRRAWTPVVVSAFHSRQRCRPAALVNAADFFAHRPTYVPTRQFAAQSTDHGQPEAAAKGDIDRENEKEDITKEEVTAEVRDDRDETKEAASSSSAVEETPAENELTVLKKEADAVTEKLKTKKHELLLALADFENNKKRFVKERESRRRTATTKFARKVVDVYVEFDSVTTSTASAGNLSEQCQALCEGVVMTRDVFKSTLERFDVLSFTPEVGQAICNDRHDIVGEGGQRSGATQVAEVSLPGWELTGKPPVVLRRAQVKAIETPIDDA